MPVRDVGYVETKGFARRIAQLLAERLPELVTAHVSKRERPGRVLVDWGQNDRHKSIVAPWSLRGGLRPTVSVPLTWDELESLGDLVFPPERALDRDHDPWAPALSLPQRLPAL